jgi:hypothetical protein
LAGNSQRDKAGANRPQWGWMKFNVDRLRFPAAQAALNRRNGNFEQRLLVIGAQMQMRGFN